MGIVFFILLAIAASLASFGLWGLFSQEGQRRFDEMDGLYPVIALAAAIAMVLLGLAMQGWQRMRRRY